ncbi:MAG: S46 family peptidase [Terriglobales bacterium]
MMKRWTLCAIVVLGLVAVAPADEGMWLFNHPPTQQVKAKYGFTLTPQWLEHTRLSSVRFNNGGSGSFVSADGLTFTNHHVAQTCLFALSTKERDLYKTGFYAKTQTDEAKCPDLELNQLVGIEDVTQKVNAGITPQTPVAEVGVKQRANMSTIEADCVKATRLRCDVVNLYAGGMFHLYKYKKYTDVRLVFAPEFQAAFFGGDPDNFEYPRYDLDITFFRVYENDRPAKLKNFFRWSKTGVKEGELVFVSGHPGSTGRLLTMAQMEFLRENSYPMVLELLERRIGLLQDYSAQSPEHARQAQESLFGAQNGFKAIKGYQSGLLDKELMAKKAAEEEKMKAAVLNDPKKKQEFGDPWSEIAEAMKVQKSFYLPLTLLERRSGGEMAEYARTLVRGAEERTKPNARRLREYRESALPSLEQNLFAANPVYKELEIVLLTDWLSELKQKLPNDPAVQKAIGDNDPAALAKRMVESSKLQDPAMRKQLWQGGQAAVNGTSDPLIVFMKTIDPEARKYRKQYEDEVDAVERREGNVLAKILFAQEGTNVPPDATFTLRLSYGAAKGFIEDGRGSVAPKGARVPYFTTIGGAFEHSEKHGGKPPYDLAPSWVAARSKLKLDTPLNFVSTPDIIGGNSGSPVVNAKGEVVGIIFDGNIQSLPWRFQYEDEVGRAVSVDARGIVEALRNVYQADRVADELVGTGGAPATVTRKKDGKAAEKMRKGEAKP